MRKKLVRGVCSVAAAVMLLCVTPVDANAEAVGSTVEVKKEDAYIYHENFVCRLLEDGSLEIADYQVEYTGEMNDVVIPEQIEGRTVTSIGDRAFQDCVDVTSIMIPDTVTHIGDYAFELCWILQSIKIPNSVTSMGANPFLDCEHLWQILVSPDHPTFAVIGSGLFEKAEKRLISHFNINKDYSYSIPQGIEVIGESALACAYMLAELEIPDSVRYIEDYAFARCGNMKEIVIPDTVEYIGDAPFWSSTGLEQVVISPEHTGYEVKDGMLFSQKDNALLGCINRDAFDSYSVPEGTKRIADYAFAFCVGLREIEIPGSVTEIGEHAFESCISLNEITIPKWVTCIQPYTFADCTALLSVSLPDELTSVGEGAFSGCEQLRILNLSETVTEIGEDAFLDTYFLKITTMPDSAAEEYCRENNIQYKFEEDYSWLPEYTPKEEEPLNLYDAAVQRYYSMSQLEILQLYTEESECTDWFIQDTDENGNFYNIQCADDGGYFDEIVTGVWYDEYGAAKAEMLPNGLLNALPLINASWYVNDFYFVDGERYTMDELKCSDTGENYQIDAPVYALVITDVTKYEENGNRYMVGTDYISDTAVVIKGSFDEVDSRDDLLVVGTYSGLASDGTPNFNGYYAEIVNERWIDQSVLGYDGEITPGLERIIEMIEAEQGETEADEEELVYDGYYLIPDSHIRKLTEADLEGMNKNRLRVARNEIYARHGRIFASEDLRSYFESMSWYNGTIRGEDFDENMLSEIERSNINLIMKVEERIGTPMAPADPSAFVGTWMRSNRSGITITCDNGVDYQIEIVWDKIVWEFTGVYDETMKGIVYTGSRTNWSWDGTPTCVYDDGSGLIYFGSDGRLYWDDWKEDMGKEFDS